MNMFEWKGSILRGINSSVPFSVINLFNVDFLALLDHISYFARNCLSAILHSYLNFLWAVLLVILNCGDHQVFSHFPITQNNPKVPVAHAESKIQRMFLNPLSKNPCLLHSNSEGPEAVD